jgi:septal ring factor EnvC (AmiA/AmiB activator)
MRSYHAAILIFAALLSAAALPCRAQETGFDSRVKKPVTESIQIRQATQKQEEQWRDDKHKLLARYQQLEAEQQQLEERRQALEEKVSATKARISQKSKQLADIEQIQSSIVPLIETLIEDLGRHLDQDLPFLTDERRQRLQRLCQLRDEPDVAVSEKLRKVMEALLVEAEYGNTIEVDQQTITLGKADMLVNIFRLGRIALFFQSLDQKTCGFYNVATSAWQVLSPSYQRTIQAAMDIGAKRRPVEILTLPLGRMRVQ